ncbi:hypothetical protein [Agromyces aureus]|uniref:Uncharacterized protein n=1 Tax=Agromyces aureus TaxID=453304 RepID=A0A191WEY9_9MICO|nr:hypothetical protein [Agromyces aureus]ANJ26826.1 hypothetical protein ATC03_08940 [Agromyces aureus]
MWSTDAALWEALRTHQKDALTVGAAFYMGAVTAPDLKVVQSGSVDVRGDSDVQSTSTVTVIGTGGSLVPKAKDAPLATYGQELSLRRSVVVGSTRLDIPLGRFRITDVTGSNERLRSGVVMDWSVQLRLQDRFEQIRADDFLAADGPRAGGTVYSELRRLSPIPVQTNTALADASVPLSTVYDTRIGAIRTLCSILGATPALTRDGVLMPRKTDRWLTDTTPDFTIDGVVDWQDSMSNDFYNQVQVRSTVNNDLVAYSSITDMSNPLAVGRAGGRTYKTAAPIYDTQAAVNAAAVTYRDRLANRRSRTVDVVCTTEALLLDVGDFGLVKDTLTGRQVLGEVTSIRYPLNPAEPIPLTLTVSEER